MTEYDQASADQICERLAGGESLRLICGADRGAALPGQTTVYRWLLESPEFQKQFQAARDALADRCMDQILEIADGEPGAPRDATRDKLRIEARKWVAARLAPGRYGDKTPAAGGAEAEPPPRVYDVGQAAARISAILEGARLRREGLED